MMNRLALVAALAVAPAASGAVIFDDFIDPLSTTNADDTFVDDAASGTSTVDGVTLTLAVGPTLPAGAIFRSNPGGTGIQSAVTGTASNSEVETGETFTLSFDTAGTLDTFRVRQFPGSSTVTFTVAGETPISVTFGEDDNSGQTLTTQQVGLAFDADEIITVSTAVKPAPGVAARGFRILELAVTPIPEPAAAGAIGAAGLALAARRRR